jgi:sugar phosphate isomerase/epimerase
LGSGSTLSSSCAASAPSTLTSRCPRAELAAARWYAAEAIRYAHAKDVAIDARRAARDGVAAACRYDDWAERPWIDRAVGFGHPESFWKDSLTTLRRGGYDDVSSIEGEESSMTTDEALEKSVEMVRRALPRGPVHSVTGSASTSGRRQAVE